VPITLDQAAGLQERLGPHVRVVAGMRFSEPSIETALRSLADEGVGHAIGVVLSPQWSDLIMGGYARGVDLARDRIGPNAPVVTMGGAWHLQPAFIEALASRIRTALAPLEAAGEHDVPVLMTAHSLPLRVADQEPGYLAQLRATAGAVAAAAELPDDRWTFCWQSAGHEPGEWMKPDFADLMPVLAAAGHRSVLVAPVQFLADHLEILYDVEIGAREQAEAVGLRFARIGSLNIDPGLIDALATFVEETAQTTV